MQLLLSERQRTILRLVVEDYVAAGQPVGSKNLVEQAGLGVSPSTVRNELAELERLGLLTHPHTSAGRVPTESGYRIYVDELLQRPASRAGGRDLRARHNLGYWLGRDYLGLGVGAVSTIENRRWRNAPSLARYLAALEAGDRPAREPELLSDEVRATERVMLGLRLDEPLSLDGLGETVDDAAVERLQAAGLAVRRQGTLALTARGRFLGGGVTARLLA